MKEEPRYIRLSIALDRADWIKLQAIAEDQARKFRTPISASAMARTAIAAYLDKPDHEELALDAHSA